MTTHRFERPGLSDDEFLRLYDSHGRPLLRFFVRRVLDPETAADLASETFAQAFASRLKFDSAKGDEAAWLFGIANNQLSHYFRHEEVSRRASRAIGLPQRALAPDDYDRIGQLSEATAMKPKIQAALGRLPDDQRLAVTRRVVDGAAYRAIAIETGTTEQAVRTHVSRGLRSLGVFLDSQHRAGTRPSPT